MISRLSFEVLTSELTAEALPPSVVQLAVQSGLIPLLSVNKGNSLARRGK
jgi:hypothetical protein